MECPMAFADGDSELPLERTAYQEWVTDKDGDTVCVAVTEEIHGWAVTCYHLKGKTLQLLGWFFTDGNYARNQAIKFAVCLADTINHNSPATDGDSVRMG